MWQGINCALHHSLALSSCETVRVRSMVVMDGGGDVGLYGANAMTMNRGVCQLLASETDGAVIPMCNRERGVHAMALC